MIADMISAILVLIGAFFVFLAGLGLLRMPDLFLRMSATSKAATLGTICILAALAIYFGGIAIASRAIATIAFVLLTAPVAAHMIGRASYFDGVPLWKRTIKDELRGRYNLKTHRLAGRRDTVQEPVTSAQPRDERRA